MERVALDDRAGTAGGQVEERTIGVPGQRPRPVAVADRRDFCAFSVEQHQVGAIFGCAQPLDGDHAPVERGERPPQRAVAVTYDQPGSDIRFSAVGAAHK